MKAGRREWLARFELADKRDAKIEELSKGNQQKVQLIGALLHDPELVILDEPMSRPRPGERRPRPAAPPRAQGGGEDDPPLDPHDGRGREDLRRHRPDPRREGRARRAPRRGAGRRRDEHRPPRVRRGRPLPRRRSPGVARGARRHEQRRAARSRRAPTRRSSSPPRCRAAPRPPLRGRAPSLEEIFIDAVGARRRRRRNAR